MASEYINISVSGPRGIYKYHVYREFNIYCLNLEPFGIYVYSWYCMILWLLRSLMVFVKGFLEISMVLLTFLFCFDSFVYGSFTIAIQVWNTAPTHTHTHARTWGHAMNIILEGSAINHIISIPHLFQWPGPEYFSPAPIVIYAPVLFQLVADTLFAPKTLFFCCFFENFNSSTHTHDHTHF